MTVAEAGEASSRPSDPRAEGWQIVTDTGFMDLVGPILFRPEEGRRVFAFVAEKKHMNRIGVVHGGMLLAFADHALGLTALDAGEGLTLVTIQLAAQFVDAMQSGDLVKADCVVIKRTRSLVFVSGTFRVGSRVVATASGVWKIVRGRGGNDDAGQSDPSAAHSVFSPR